MYKEDKSYILYPDWRDRFLWYLPAIILMPLAGLGLVLILYLRSRQLRSKYVITDDSVARYYEREVTLLGLADIRQMEVKQSRLERRLNIGRLYLQSDKQELVMRGVEAPEQLKRLILKAVEIEKQRMRQADKIKGHHPEHKAGSLDKQNTLVGLWQQGLISDEDYERERKRL